MKLRPLFPLTWLFLIATVAVTAQENQPPELEYIGPKSTTEGEQLIFDISASDPDGDTLVLWAEPSPLPWGAEFVNHWNGTGTFDGTPSYTQAGTYYVTFKAADTEFTVSEVVRIDVEEFFPGIRDTVELVVTMKPDEAQSQFNVELGLYVFSDSAVSGADAGFFWDNPNLRMDSAVAMALTDSGFGFGPFFYEKGSIDTTNVNQRFIFSGTYWPPEYPGISGDGNGRRHWATYYFTLSDWNATDSMVIDSTLVPPSHYLELSFPLNGGPSLISYVPSWKGKVVIKDASDVKVVEGGELPERYSMSQNYPNPFNPTTQINFEIPVRSHVTLTVYNLLGQKVTTLVDKEMSAGRYIADWNSTSDGGTKVASGVYFYKLEAGDFIQTKKMMLLK